jgi:hypothetical protein
MRDALKTRRPIMHLGQGHRKNRRFSCQQNVPDLAIPQKVAGQSAQFVASFKHRIVAASK